MSRMHVKPIYVFTILLSITVTATAQDIDFRLSVKYILDSFNNRPSGTHSADSTVQNVIDQSNEALKRWGRGYRYVITEFREVSGATAFYNLDEDQSGTEFKGLEDAAEANPSQFHWRTDATNIFIVNSYRGGSGAAAAIPSSPNDQGYELVVVSINTGPPLVWPHELGHHNALYHTFDEDSVADTREDPNPLQCLVPFECDLGGTAECCCSLKIVLLDAAAQNYGWTQQEYEDLRWNLMNYNAAWDCVPMMDFADVRMTEGQPGRW